MDAHDFIRAVAKALKDCTAHGLGGGHDDRERAEFLDLPRSLAIPLKGAGVTTTGLQVEANGQFLTARSPCGRWIVHLEFEIKE